jgi:FkbM family methyltransferase
MADYAGGKRDSGHTSSRHRQREVNSALDMSLEFRRDLIFDVGMNDGRDTAFYLHRGFRVVAVEANPVLYQAGARNFANAIESGRLVIEGVAVGPDRGKLPFYVSSKDIWSSFDRASATREGCTCTTIQVSSVRMADLFTKHGVPHYIKIDIEGADTYCLADLSESCLPDYISFEDGPETEQDLRRLYRLGYRRFKLINQDGLAFRSDFEVEPTSRRLYRRVRRKFKNVVRGRWYNDWNFEIGSSGPFGEETDGRWVCFEDFLKIRHRWRELQSRQAGSRFWYDIHAGR